MDFRLTELFEDLPTIRVVDVGASAIDGPPAYQKLIELGKAEVVGFEPDVAQFDVLAKLGQAFATYLPYALGDGNEAVLRVCKAAGMNSLLEPDPEILGHFHGFGEWGQVVERRTIPTRRLDDVAEVPAIDYLKLDVQGAELSVLRGGASKVAAALVIQTEVLFVPFYKDQPMFAEVDLELRRTGYFFHRFTPLVSRLFKPLMRNNDIYSPLSQILWSDAVYVRKFTEFDRLSSTSLLKIALVLHAVYGSFDLAALALQHADRLDGTNRHARYVERLAGVLGQNL